MRDLDSIRQLSVEAGAKAAEAIKAGKPFTIWLWAHGRQRHGTNLPAGEGPPTTEYATHFATDPEETAAALRNLARTALDAAEKIENAGRQRRGLKPLPGILASAKRRAAALPHLHS